MSPFTRIKLRVSRRNRVGGEPQNGVKCRHRVEPTIEAEHVFVEIGLQMLGLDTTMMRPPDPSFQVAENEMDHGQMRFGLVGVAAERQHVMAIPDFGKARIVCPSVRTHDSAGRDVLFDKAGQGTG